MQIWKDHTGTTRELRLTVGVASRVLKHFPAVDVLGSPEQVEVLLNRPDYLLPLAVGMGAAPEVALAQCEDLGDDLDGPLYASLLKAVQDELTDFFQEPTKSRLLEIRALTRQEEDLRMQEMRSRISPPAANAPTASEPTGQPSAKNGLGSSESTPSHSPPDSSTSDSEAAASTSGNTPPA